MSSGQLMSICMFLYELCQVTDEVIQRFASSAYLFEYPILKCKLIAVLECIIKCHWLNVNICGSLV